MKSTCIAAMYHYVRDVEKTAFPAIKGLSIKDFETQLDWLQKTTTELNGATLDAALSGNIPQQQASVLTFDDGLTDHYKNVLPILKRRGITGFFFLTGNILAPRQTVLNVHKVHFLMAKMGEAAFQTELYRLLKERGQDVPIPQMDATGLYRYDSAATAQLKKLLNYELPYPVLDEVLHVMFAEMFGDEESFAASLYLSRSMIEEMAAAGMTFGGHTQTHRVLSRLSSAEQERELTNMIGVIKEWTGQKTVPFAFPYGHKQTYTPDTLNILKQEGYSCGFTTTRGAIEWETVNKFEFPRYDTKDLPPFKEQNI